MRFLRDVSGDANDYSSTKGRSLPPPQPRSLKHPSQHLSSDSGSLAHRSWGSRRLRLQVVRLSRATPSPPPMRSVSPSARAPMPLSIAAPVTVTAAALGCPAASSAPALREEPTRPSPYTGMLENAAFIGLFLTCSSTEIQGNIFTRFHPTPFLAMPDLSRKRERGRISTAIP